MRNTNSNYTSRERDLLSRLEAANERAGVYKERLRRSAYDKRRVEKNRSRKVTVTSIDG